MCMKERDTSVKLQGAEVVVLKLDKFKYLRSTIQSNSGQER